jgi:endonuclease YncB( thermonuclease family)
VTRRLAPVLLAGLLAACTAEDAGLTVTAPETTVTTSPAAPTSAGTEAIVLEVFDGDTLLVSLDGAEEEVRLLGVNAPEQDECFGDRAREALSDLLAAGPLQLDIQDERDQYGRLLAYAHADGTFVNLSLVAAGFALAMHEDPPRLAEILEAGERAFAGGRGLWAADACGTPAAAALTLADLQPNPPGPDEDDLNGEWALLQNLGGRGADLTGWVLRDESSANRYHFPAGTLLAPGGQVTVHTGCGRDTPDALYWCHDGPVWNNGGDTALLLDPQGNVAGRLGYSG